MKKLGLVFVLGAFLFSCKGYIENEMSPSEKTCLLTFSSDDEKIATVEILTLEGAKVESGGRLNSGSKITVQAMFKDYDFEVDSWEINSEKRNQKLKSFSYIVEKDVSFHLKLHKIIFDDSKPNIVFKIPEIDGKDEVDLMLQLAGKKAGETIQIDFGDGIKTDYTFPSIEASQINRTIDIPTEVKIYGHLTLLDATQNKYINEITFYNSNTLRIARLSQNRISKIDLTTIPACKELQITDNKITEIDLSPCRELEEFYCGYNKVAKIDVSQNKSLTVLNCYNTDITELDISNNPLLEVLRAGDNKYSKEIILDSNLLLKSIDLENSGFSSVNFSKLTKLQKLRLKGNKISSIRLENNTEIDYLDLGDNALESLDVSMLPLLEELRCNKNKLKSLDFSKNKKLNIINLQNNEFSACSLNQLFLNMNPPVDNNNGFAIAGNDGASASNTKIAKDKGWRLDVEGDGSAICE